MFNNTYALKIVDYIIENNLKAGAKLPSIRELAQLMDCSPSQIRTGLITLSALGVLDMHSRAGSFVKSLSTEDLENVFILFFKMGLISEHDETSNIYMVKTILDREVFLNATRYRTDQDLFDLSEILANEASAVDDVVEFVKTDETFHLRIAQIIRNQVIVYLLDAIQVMLRPYRHANLTPEICRESYISHLEIYKAIEAKDEESAVRAAVQHTMARLQRLAQRNLAQRDSEVQK